MSDMPTTPRRVQRQIDAISNAETEELARISKYICAGYQLALLFEGLSNNIEHTELDEAAIRVCERMAGVFVREIEQAAAKE